MRVTRFAVVRVVYCDDKVYGLSVPAVFDGENAQLLANDYVRRHLVVPPDDQVAMRIEYTVSPIANVPPDQIKAPINHRQVGKVGGHRG